MKANLNDLPDQELLEIYNAHNKDKALKKWTKSRAALIKAIEKVAPKTRKQRGKTIRDRSIELLCYVDYYESRGEDPGPANRVDPKTPNARTVGLSYKSIVNKLLHEFPTCETSVGCLRWYVTRINAGEEGYQGYVLPNRRPRK